MAGWLTCLLLVIVQTPPRVGPAPSPKPQTASPKELQELSSKLKEIILKNVPSPLHESSSSSGHTPYSGDTVDPTKTRSKRDEKNSGKWRKIRVTADDI